MSCRAVLSPLLCGLSVCAQSTGAQAPSPPAQASGGVLRDDQACYDVAAYDLRIRVDPGTRCVDGELTMTARMVAASPRIGLDLDAALELRGVWLDGEPVPSIRDGHRFSFACGRRPGEEFRVRVAYGGEPRTAPNPPWAGGFTWKQTAAGAPWIATTCQGEGADLWWPCKDHPSDKAERFDLRVQVPRDLVCASNGRLISDTVGDDGWRTFHWRVSVPIANYCVALNIAPYEVIESSFASVAGETVPVSFYVLPENRARAEGALPEFLDHLHHMEEVCGPYPFRAEKYGIVETPHLGMEHQTIIAYGNRYRKTAFAYDWLHHHEMCHEWWANLVTCRDWKDMWIHEGIGTYMQALYIESRRGREQYFAEMRLKRRQLGNRRAVAPREVQDSKQIYFDPAGGGANDIYYKGSWVMHTLRWLLGDERFFVALRRLAYPQPELEAATDGSCCRFEDTEGVRSIFEAHGGQELGWFFEVYLRQQALPELEATRTAGTLALRWKVPGGLPFPMPVPVAVDGELRRVAMLAGGAELEIGSGQQVEVDPQGWLLKVEERR